jgi:hypothetical protein
MNAIADSRAAIENLIAKIENHQNPIQLEIVDKGNFNFPISSKPKREGVRELKFPKSLQQNTRNNET